MEELSVWVIVAQLINFWIVFFIFKKFLWNKIVQAIEERKETLKNIENSEKKAQEAIATAELKAEEIIHDAKMRSDELKKEAEVLARRTKEKIIADAEREGKSLLDSASTDIERMKNTMFESIKTKIVDISLKLNKQLFNKEIASKDFMEKQYDSFKN